MRLFRRRPAPPADLPHPVSAVIDDLSEAFAAHPGHVTALLLHHADAAFRLDAAELDPGTPPHQLATLAAEADGTRAALLALSPTARHLHLTRIPGALETDR